MNNDQWLTVCRGAPLRSPVCKGEKSFAQLEFSYYLIFSYSVIQLFNYSVIQLFSYSYLMYMQ
jgi:hypothetical protein